jgi:predicted DsbA family dithiol-disulfide isomerase
LHTTGTDVRREVSSVQVEVFSDVVCPWCYVGKRRLEAALALFPHADAETVTFRSFQLDPSTPREMDGTLTERLAAKYGVSVGQAKAMNQRVTDVAATVGLDFHLDRAHPANTFDAHRLLHYAAAHGRQPELTEGLMRAYFTEGGRIGDHSALSRYAADAGLDPQGAAGALTGPDGDGYADAVRADLSLARSFGITAVPFFVIDRRYGVAGAQETGVLLQTLETAWAEANPLTVVSSRANTGSDAACDDGSCAV